jgi:hypothetical protein
MNALSEFPDRDHRHRLGLLAKNVPQTDFALDGQAPIKAPPTAKLVARAFLSGRLSALFVVARSGNPLPCIVASCGMPAARRKGIDAAETTCGDEPLAVLAG